MCLFSPSACVCSLPSFGYLSVLLNNYFLLKNLANTSILCLNSTSALGFADTEVVLFFYLELKILVIFACFLPSTPISFFCGFGYYLTQSLNLLVYTDTSPSVTRQPNNANSHWFIPQWRPKLHGPTPFRKHFHSPGATWTWPPGIFLCFLSLPSNWLCWCYGSNQPRLASPQVSELFIMFSMCSQHTSSKT